MSGAANLAGLFPPKNQQLWNEQLHWQPIPIHTIPKESDYYISADASCARYDQLKEIYIETDDLFERYNELFAYLAKMTGKPIEKLEDAVLIYDTLTVESVFKKKE